MKTAGYAGKILKVNLTDRSTSVLDTAKYEEFGGGNGIGTALFWEFCRDKTISGFDPANVITITNGPLSGTPTPGTGRTEICGINVFSYPVEWFSRSNIGGFFGAMMKYAGWDGIVITGKADRPVWLNIIDDKLTIEDAGGLWGMDAVAAQEEIWRRVTGRESFGEWLFPDETPTTQGPSVLCIGPAGETLSRLGTIQSGNGMSASQGGYGGVWGAKNLKAVSIVGSGGIKVADPAALLRARKWLAGVIEKRVVPADGRRTSCSGCFQQCKFRVSSGVKNDNQCLAMMYNTEVPPGGYSGTDTLQRCGLNLNDLTGVALTDGVYLDKLYKEGVLGPGKPIDSAPLPMDDFGSAAYAEALCKAIVRREGIGADLAEGYMRAAAKWGRLEADLASGTLHKPHWGYGWHWSLPFVEQTYGSLVGEREVTEHCFEGHRTIVYLNEIAEKLSAEQLVTVLSRKLIPYEDDPFMLDYSWQGADGGNMKRALETGIYSRHRAKLVAWHRHYTRFWAESVLYCDWVWPIWFNRERADYSGFTPESEPRFLNTVTGRKTTFAEGMETGRKIWNLNRAIWTLQGRHRDAEKLAGFMFTPAGSHARTVPDFLQETNVPLPVYDKGKWRLERLGDMYLDEAGVEQWKTHYYEVEGWDTTTGWPTGKTLEELGLRDAADTLAKAGRLGASG